MPFLNRLRDGLREVVIPPNGQLPALDALRTFAVLLVVCGHFVERGRRVFASASPFVLDSPIVQYGWAGVDLFFVLSGFLIGRQLWSEFDRTGSVDGVRFVLRRGFRIWPLYFVFVLVSPALTDTWKYRWTDWFFLSNYFGGRVEGGWSLSTEEQFYILMPLAIVLLARRVRLRGWLLLLTTLLVAVVAARYAASRELLAAGARLEDVRQAMYFPFHLHADGLFIGLLVALVSVVRPAWVFATSTSQMWRTWGAVGGAVLTGVALRSVDAAVFSYLSLGLIFGGAMTALLADHARVFRVLYARPFFVFSKLSFGMYLNHFAILRWIQPSLSDGIASVIGSGTSGFLVAMVAAIVCSLVVSCAMFLLVERPFLRLRDRYLERRAPQGRPVRDPGYRLPFRGARGATATEAMTPGPGRVD